MILAFAIVIGMYFAAYQADKNYDALCSCIGIIVPLVLLYSYFVALFN